MKRLYSIILSLSLVLMLAKPVLRVVHTRTQQGYVAVLVDNSASMLIADTQYPPHERLRLAGMLSDVPAARRPWQLDRGAAALSAIAPMMMMGGPGGGR